MKLDVWCKTNPKRAVALRERLGKKTYYKYLRGDVSRADPESVAAIVEVTRHQVTANDLYGIDPMRAARATMELAAA